MKNNTEDSKVMINIVKKALSMTTITALALRRTNTPIDQGVENVADTCVKFANTFLNEYTKNLFLNNLHYNIMTAEKYITDEDIKRCDDEEQRMLIIARIVEEMTEECETVYDHITTICFPGSILNLEEINFNKSFSFENYGDADEIMRDVLGLNDNDDHYDENTEENSNVQFLDPNNLPDDVPDEIRDFLAKLSNGEIGDINPRTDINREKIEIGDKIILHKELFTSMLINEDGTQVWKKSDGPKNYPMIRLLNKEATVIDSGLEVDYMCANCTGIHQANLKVHFTESDEIFFIDSDYTIPLSKYTAEDYGKEMGN